MEGGVGGGGKGRGRKRKGRGGRRRIVSFPDPTLSLAGRRARGVHETRRRKGGRRKGGRRAERRTRGGEILPTLAVG